MRRPRWSTILGAALALGLAGCGSASINAPERTTLEALALPAPKSQTTTTSSTSSATPPARCGVKTASLRPPATPPRPGAMPAGSEMAKIQHRGYLIVGVDQSTLRFAYFNPLHGHIEGFEIDLVQKIADAIFGHRRNDIRYKAITTDERVPDVKNGSVDIVADAMTITCQRKQQVDFSTVYYDAGQKLLVPKNSPVHSVADLGGQPVCATRGSTSLTTLLEQRPQPKPYEVDQRTDCLVALQQGLVAAVTSDDSILLGFEAQDPNLRIAGPAFAPEPYGMAINKAHPDLVRFVNGVLEQLRQDGGWRAIYKTWIGPYVKSIPSPPTPTYDG